MTEPVRGEFRRAPCTRAGHHAYLGGLLEHTVSVGDPRRRGLPAAPQARLRPADGGGDRPRRRQGARVHLRRRVRAQRGGPRARPPGDRRRDRRRGGRAPRPSAGALALLGCVLCHHGPDQGPARGRAERRRDAQRLPLGRGAGALPAQRARRRRSRTRSSTGVRRGPSPPAGSAERRRRAAAPRTPSSSARSETAFETSTPISTPSGERTPITMPSRTRTLP